MPLWLKLAVAMLAVLIGLAVAVLIIVAIDPPDGCTKCCEYVDDNQRWLDCMTAWPKD